jgi:DNA-binding SARP family transcriptional activator
MLMNFTPKTIEQTAVAISPPSPVTSPLLICLLGEFRLLKRGQPIPIHGGKAEMLLRYLALHHHQPIPRPLLLEWIWPGHDPLLAGQSLNSLTYSLRKWLGDGLGGESPVLHEDGYYRLNEEAGVEVDMAAFEAFVKMGDQHSFANRLTAAIPCYTRAEQLYRGDLCADTDINTVMVRERLRAHFLAVLARLADYYFSVNEYGRCLYYATRLLENDPCREDAHRLAMRCYVRQGQRAQALRQYQLCLNILETEFEATPEAHTTLLYDQVRLQPHTV